MTGKQTSGKSRVVKAACSQELIEGQYSIYDLVDLDHLKEILKDFTKLTGLAVGFVSSPGLEILITEGWRAICSNFHRKLAGGEALCTASDQILWNKALHAGDIEIAPCGLGMVDGATPVVLNGKRIALLVAGQVFLKEPDLDVFRRQAKQYGFDQAAYLRAVKQVPVVSEERLRTALALLNGIAEEIAGQSLDRLRTLETAHMLQQEAEQHHQAEKALHESENKLRSLVEQIPAAVYTRAGSGNSTLYITPMIENMTGYSAGEWIENPGLWQQILHADDRQAFLAEQRRAHKAQDKIEMEYRLVARDGHTVWVRDEATPLKDEKGKLTGWQGFLLDITDSKLAEMAQQQAEQRYRTLVEQLPMIIYTDSAELMGHTIYVSPQIKSIMGYEPQEWCAGQGTPWTNLVEPEDREQVLAEYERTFQSGEPFKMEYRMRARDGRLVWLRDEAVLVRDAMGQGVFWHGIMLDITERKQAEIDLAESEERYHRLFDLSPEAIVVHRQGKVQLVNEAAMNIVGASQPEELLGKPVLDFVHPAYRARVVERTRQEQVGRGPVPSMEEKFIRLDGSVVDVEVIGAPIRFRDAPASLVIFHEITERRRAEERLNRQFKELTVLHAVGTGLTQSTNLDELIQNVISAVGDTLFPVNFGVLLVDEKRDVLWHHPSYRGNATPAERAELFIPMGKGITGSVAKSGKPRRIGDVSQATDYLNLNDPTRSELCVPLKVGEKVIGVINTESPLAEAFTEEDERLLTTIASQMSVAIEKMNLFETERLRRLEAETLSQVAQVVTASLDVKQVLRSMLAQLKQLLVYDTASVMLWGKSAQADTIADMDYEDGEMTSQAARNLLRDSPILKKMAEDLRAVNIPDVTQDPEWIWVPGARHVRSYMAVPLIVHHTMVGVLEADKSTPGFFTEDNLRVTRAFAQQMSIALENARLYQDAVRAADRHAILHRVSQEMVTAIQEPEQTYRSIHEATRKLMPCDSFVISLYDRERNQSTMVYALEGDHRFPVQTIPAGRGLTGRVVAGGESVIIDDLLQDKVDVIRIGEPQPIRSLVAVPLRLGQNTTGMISAQCYQVGAYGPQEQALLEMLASYAAVAIENARLYQEAVRAAERRAVVHEASQEIIKVGLDLEKVYEAIHRAAGKLMPAEAFVLSVLDAANDQIQFAYLYDEGKRWPSTNSPTGTGLSGKIIETGQALIINDVELTPVPEGIDFGEGEGVRSILAVPLRLGNKVFGMLSVQSYQPYTYTEDDQALLEMLGAHATAAIENARLFSETRQRLTELEAVNRISTALRVAQTAEQMLPVLLDETLRILDCETGGLWLYNRTAGLLERVDARGWFAQIHEAPTRPGEGITGKVFKTATPIITREFIADERAREDTRRLLRPGWGGACVPIRSGQEVIGVLLVSVQLPRQLTQGDVDLLTTITEIAGNAIQRTNLYEQSQRQLQRLASLRTIDMAINTVLDLRVTLSILLDHLLSQLNVDAVAVFLQNPTTQQLSHSASAGFRTPMITDGGVNLNEELTGQVARTRASVYVPDLEREPAFIRRTLFAAEDFVSYFGVPLLAKGQIKGVLEIFHRSPLTPDTEWKNFLETLAGQAAIAIDNATLFEELQRSNVELSLAYDATIEGWSKALDLRDRETEGHTQRVTEITLTLAKKLGMSDTEQVHIRRGALLHDIGKMGVPDNILYKAGPLDEHEWDVMHQHPLFAYQMLHPISYLRPALDIPFSHHERWDGSGYPNRLRGEQIPVAARIFSVVDVWDALTSDRPYRKAWTRKRALAYIQKSSGTQFDPQVVQNFLELVQRPK